MSATSHKLPRAVWLFGFTSLVNDFASEMIYPLLPAFVTGALGGGALALGILDGVADAVAALFKLVSGYLAERPRLRGPLVVAGYAVAAAIRPLIAVGGRPGRSSRSGAPTGWARGSARRPATRSSPTWSRRKSAAAPSGCSARRTTWAPSSGP